MAILSAGLSAGCNLYWSHHSGDDICVANGAADDVAPEAELRNPDTGDCQPFGWGGCDNSCGPCAESGADAALPNWPACFGACDGLGEAACLTTASCHAAYTDVLTIVDGLPPQFWQCWDTNSPFGVPPTTTGACNDLDSTSCAFRDDCIGVFSLVEGRHFETCAAEPSNTSCAATDCGPGSHCEQQCTDSSCQAFCIPDELCSGVDCGAGSTCVETCDPVTGTCQASCVAMTACEALTTEPTCKSRSDCEPVYKGEDCTCYPDHCDCAIETYERCQAL